MLRKGLLSIDDEVKASATGAAAKSLISTSSPTRRSGVNVVVAVVGGMHFSGRSFVCRGGSSLYSG